MPGSGKLTITGQLGDVMRESAQAALSYVRSHAHELAPEVADDWFADHDLHVHVPPGRRPRTAPARASRWPRPSPRSSPAGRCATTSR